MQVNAIDFTGKMFTFRNIYLCKSTISNHIWFPMPFLITCSNSQRSSLKFNTGSQRVTLSWTNRLLFLEKWAWDAFVHTKLHSNYRRNPCISLPFFFRYTYQTRGVQIVLTWMWWTRPLQHPTQIECNFRMLYHRADSLRKKALNVPLKY